MVKFLIKRPIAVLMSTIALVILGSISFFNLPVSLLPDIDIPHIKVRFDYKNSDARSIENNITKPLRHELSQVSGLNNISSQTFDGFGIINMEFDYKTKTDYAFIETNEKIDAVISQLPRDLSRPVVIKEKPSDIPVFYLSVYPDSAFYEKGGNYNDFSNLCNSTFKRRIEQLSQVAMVDVSGFSHTEMIIVPHEDKMRALSVSYSDITNTIEKNNIRASSMSFTQGHYIYNLRLESYPLDANRILNLTFAKNGKVFKIKDFADVKINTGNNFSMFLNNNNQGVSFAVYKHSSARMQDVKNAVKNTLENLKEDYPDLCINIERDQTRLLEFSINNLLQTLILSVIFAIVILLFFVKQWRFIFVIAISIPITIIISFSMMELMDIPLSIISLSGLILSVGLMIDNSIIVIDNINQIREKLGDTSQAVIIGTNEIIRPLISSVLTTCAVFLPLISLSGIAGAIFYDQAVTITVSLIVSLFASIILIPVLYRLFINDNSKTNNTSFSNSLVSFYEKVLNRLMNYKVAAFFLFILIIPAGIALYFYIPKEKFPQISQHDFLCKISWNENITISENRIRVVSLINSLNDKPEYISTYLGKNEFFMSDDKQNTIDLVTLYLDYGETISMDNVSEKIERSINELFPNANISFAPSENVFRSIFTSNTDEALLKFRKISSSEIYFNDIIEINKSLEVHNIQHKEYNLFNNIYELYPIQENLILYNVDYKAFINKLKIVFGGTIIEELSDGEQTINLILKQNNRTISDILNSEYIHNTNNNPVPLKVLLTYRRINTLKKITADTKGEYYGLNLPEITNSDAKLKENITRAITKVNDIEVTFPNDASREKILFFDLLKILIISLLLLYLILAAQFESLLLPLIILFEMIFDIAGALLFLYLFDQSINIMSGLGIIVMSGIIINDSILKIDTIHKNYLGGMKLKEAIFNGGHRRFLPIIMTTLTTVFALLPVLFFTGIGVELQLPLALSIMGGLLLGTVISLFIIPLMYYFYGSFVIRR